MTNSSLDSDNNSVHSKNSTESLPRSQHEPMDLHRSDSHYSTRLSHIISGIKDDLYQEHAEDDTYSNRRLPEEVLAGRLESVSRMSTRREEDPEEIAEEVLEKEQNAPPVDKGYAWVVCMSCVLIVISTWGANAGYGIFLNFYLNNGTFPGATHYDYALVGGLVTFLAMLLAPISALLYAMFGIRTMCFVGTALQLAAYILASFSTKIWQLYCTQGVLVGVSFALIFIPATLVLPTWFVKHKAFAMGLTVSGAGLGGVLFSLSLNKVIQDTGDQKWALRMTGIISTVLSLVAAVLLKPRIDTRPPRSVTMKWDFIWTTLKNIFDYHVFGYWPLLVLTAWFSIVMLGYILVLFSVSSYAHSVGLTAAQGSALTAILNAGQALGRPTIGHLGDRFGRSNIGALYCLIITIFCLAYWINAKSYGALIPFAIFMGFFVGVGSTLAQPIATDIVSDPASLAGAWSSINVVSSVFCLVAEVIALALTQKNSPTPYLHTQIFAGVAFFASMLLMLQIRSHLVAKFCEQRKTIAQERLDELRTPKGRYLKAEDLEQAQMDTSEEEALLEERIARVRSGGTFSSVNQFFSQTFGNGLDVSESSFSGTDGQQGDSLVNSSQWRDIDGLSSDGTGRTDSGGVFSWARVDNSVNNDLDRVLFGQDVDDFQSVLNDSNSLQFLTVVSTVHHQRVGQSFDDRASSLSESLGSVSSSGVRDKDWLSDLDVVN